MKNYTNSDYALNKHSNSIVYHFADGVAEVTLEYYLAENPCKTEADFIELKALSDGDYYERDRNEYRQTWKNIPLDCVEDTDACAVPSPEEEITERSEWAINRKHKLELAAQIMDKLTDIQRQRYLLYHVKGLNEREIAEKEGSTQQAVSKSLCWVEKKIKKFLLNSKK